MNTSARTRLPLVVLPLLIAPIGAFSPEKAAAQSIVKCTGADGTTIFTDRSCDSFGATLAKDFAFAGAENSAPGQLREPPQNVTEDGFVGNGFAIKGCARTQGELIAGVREAISRGDANRLANYYHWTGMSSSAAFSVMERLDKMARNTMASVAFDYPQPTYELAEPAMQYTRNDEPATTASLSAAVYLAASGGPSTFGGYQESNAEAGYSPGVLDASLPLGDKPVMAAAAVPVATSTAVGGTNAAEMLGGTVDASTPLGGAMTTLAHSGYGYSSYNPRPSAVRVNLGGGTGQRFALKQNAGCWFMSF